MNKKTNQLNILDVTIRDGSYVNKFTFTPEEVAKIVRRLSDAGVKYIEASHGLGVGSAKKGLPSGATDEEYAEAAMSAKGNSNVGAIGHYKVTTLDEIKTLSKYLDFFRIVSNPTDPDALRPFIDTCNELNLPIFIQFSRSPMVSKDKLADSVEKVHSWGADVIYIVDTSSSFIPEDIGDYIGEIKKRTDATIGFHGHNAFSLALINTIEAIKAGCEFVDASLLGIGRDNGNVPIATLVAVMERYNIPCNLSIKKLMFAGDELIKPILDNTPYPSWYTLYFACKKRDFWPYTLLEFIAKDCGKSMWDVLEIFTSIPGVIEAEKEDLEELIKRLGKDPQDVFKRFAQSKDIF